jgi:hypothetical protein
LCRPQVQSSGIVAARGLDFNKDQLGTIARYQINFTRNPTPAPHDNLAAIRLKVSANGVFGSDPLEMVDLPTRLARRSHYSSDFRPRAIW